MSTGVELRLPEPARGLWLRTRDAIRTSLDEIGISEYAIGGGTILAARWEHHRASDYIDLSLPAYARLDRLDDRATCGLRKRMEQLGGACDTETQGAVYRIAFAVSRASTCGRIAPNQRVPNGGSASKGATRPRSPRCRSCGAS